MKREKRYTVGEVAACCQVSGQSVRNWIEAGAIKSYSTPGGHRRVLRSDLVEFLERHGMPPLQEDEEATRVLVVDDDKKVLATITKILQKQGGFRVRSAASGFDAGVEIMTWSPQLVVLDLYMPGLDGFEVCRRVRSTPEAADTRILAVTASPDDDTLARAMAAGADACLAKPFLRGELMQAARMLLADSHRRGTMRA